MSRERVEMIEIVLAAIAAAGLASGFIYLLALAGEPQSTWLLGLLGVAL